MTVPKYQELTRPIAQYLAGKPYANLADMKAPLARHFLLTEEDLRERTSKSIRTRLDTNIEYACRYLLHAGLLDHPGPENKSLFRITDVGLRELETGPARFDEKFLNKFDSFRKFIADSRANAKARAKIRGKRKQKAGAAGGRKGSSKASGAPLLSGPEASLDKAATELRDAAITELKALIAGLEEKAFTRLIFSVMLSRGLSPRCLGQNSGDIKSGIVMGSELNRDAVLVKAMRGGSTPHGEREIQSFEGEIGASGAARGILVSGVTFLPQARDNARKSAVETWLVDGDELARLMYDSGVGTRTSSTYELKKVSQGFFSKLGKQSD
jgi:restriction system protein